MSDERDAFIDELVDEALERYRGIVSPEALQAMREMMESALATHPDASELVNRARPRTDNKQSDDYERGTLDARKPEPGASDKEGSGTGGAR